MGLELRTSNNKHILAFKGESISNSGDIAWPEWENEIDNYEDLKKLLIGCGFNNFVNIRKSRDTYKLGEYEINIDSIEGLGKFIEVELLITNDKLIETGKKQIVDFLQSLGIKEKDIVNKGYVPLCVEAGIV